MLKDSLIQTLETHIKLIKEISFNIPPLVRIKTKYMQISKNNLNLIKTIFHMLIQLNFYSSILIHIEITISPNGYLMRLHLNPCLMKCFLLQCLIYSPSPQYRNNYHLNSKNKSIMKPLNRQYMITQMSKTNLVMT